MKNKKIIIQSPSTNCGLYAEKILRALPDWFGIEKSIIQYIKEADNLPTIQVKDDNTFIDKHFVSNYTNLDNYGKMEYLLFVRDKYFLQQLHNRYVSKTFLKLLDMQHNLELNWLNIINKKNEKFIKSVVYGLNILPDEKRIITMTFPYDLKNIKPDGKYHMDISLTH